MPDFTKPPLSYYAPPGFVRVSPEALKVARNLDHTVRHTTRLRDPVVSFEWLTGRNVRRRPEGPEDLGPGLELRAGERADVPPEAIETIDGVDLAIKVPKDVYEKTRERLIDVEKTARAGLVLR